MKNKKSILKPAVIAAAALMIFTGSTYSYLTDYDTADNDFTIGKVTIDLEEPNWKPEENKSLTPNSEVAKDPQIVNTGINDSYVYLEVSIPRAVVATADTAGNRKDATLTDLFSFDASKKWTLLNTTQTNEAVTYFYAYNEILKPGKTTSPLFEKVKFVNLIEGQMDGETITIPLHAYAIQSANTGDNKETVPEQAEAAYAKYLKQNPPQSTSDKD
ncbi:MAG: TasA family protein [Eubacteriales bacterium]|nr:TasA family protein [Eubacteriales bacterium]